MEMEEATPARRRSHRRDPVESGDAEGDAVEEEEEGPKVGGKRKIGA